MTEMITGHKGGSSNPRTPVEAPDSVQSIARAKILLALGEGEFDGLVDAQDIYLDGTPLQAADGTENFPGVKWEFRPGSVDQTYIQGIPSVDNEIAVGVELRSDTPWVRAVSNLQLSAVRIRLGWPTLQQQLDNGDVVGYTIDYAIDLSTNDGAYQQVLTASLSAKTTTLYERSHRIDLPASTSGWQVRVRRLTANQNNNRIADTMQVQAITEVIDAKLRYPNTALLYVEFDASTFQSIPQISVDANGRRVQVPSNYDPATRTYIGTWDGSFKQAWTTNPAWHFYDIVLNKRFGLGRRIDASMLNKWSLYRISQYCDVMVSNGQGGQEPRFTCNMYIQSRADAWQVLSDMAAIFRGMTYWSGSELVVDADMPEDDAYRFSPSNVIGGRFSYNSSSHRDRHTLALVNWDNPTNNYQSETRPVPNLRAQARYGIVPLEMTAIGCTSASEAERRGQWALLTEELEKDQVTFQSSIEARGLGPGKIISVADPVRSGKAIGGRIVAVAGRVVTVDRDIQAAAGDRLLVNLLDGNAEARTIQSVAGRTVTVTANFTQTLLPQLQWQLESDSLAVQRFRILSITRPSPGVHEITALQHVASKFDAIDNGTRIELPPITVIPPSVQAPPSDIVVGSSVSLAQGLAVTKMTISWKAAAKAVAYEVQWRKDSGNWVSVPRTGGLSVDVDGIYAGRYLARVRALNVQDVASVWATGVETQLSGKTTPPPVLAYLHTTPGPWKIQLDWGFPAGAEDTAFTELQQSTTPGGSEQTASALGLFAYPTDTHTVMPMPAGARLAFRGRLIDRTGNVGAWSAWVDGITSSDASEYNELITKEYVESALGEEFFDQIDQMQVDVDQLMGQYYDPTMTYQEGEILRQGNRLYQAIQDVPANNPPPDPAYWIDVGQAVESANGLAVQVQENTAAIEDLDGKVQASAGRLDVLLAQYRDDDGEGDLQDALSGASAQGQIVEERKTRATENRAMASVVEQVSAETAVNSALIEETASVVADVNEGVQAMWSVKLQVSSGGQQYAAGFQLGFDGGTSLTTMAFQADRFLFFNASTGSTVAPVSIVGGQMFINSAMIQDASITNAKIGDVIQSTALGSNGQPLWQLNKAGSFLLNSAGSGGQMQQTAEAIKIYDGSGVLRVQLGNLSV
ncbi:host specificity protein J [Pseudomonas citronellolis]|jgi:predicted phage tail protein|uniref:host specificity protein J n=1 Tax=Pseudomonas citronellolis TaxID=53408 RepID=UPI00389A9130